MARAKGIAAGWKLTKIVYLVRLCTDLFGISVPYVVGIQFPNVKRAASGILRVLVPSVSVVTGLRMKSVRCMENSRLQVKRAGMRAGVLCLN